ncbi:MAG: alpha/beta fold hydrolase [Candidatus Eiseniibacteriota bacterium]
MKNTRTVASLTRTAAMACLASVLAAGTARGQEACIRIMIQDPALNNLVDPPGYETADLGTLGGVLRQGTGDRAMILVPGLGFSGGVFAEFMKAHASDYRMVAVTLPGFGGTPAPRSPSETTSFGEQTWTTAALGAIERLMDGENMEDAVVVGHWIGGTQVALRLAMARPDRVAAVVLLAGSARMTTTDPERAAWISTPERRLISIDKYMAPLWFKTVTRETWDDNNFLPSDYAVDPVRGLRLWREAATPKLHVWVRYLCEYNAQDICAELGDLAVPTLLLEPGLEGAAHDPDNDYMKSLCHDSWDGCIGSGAPFTRRVVPDSRACLWFDRPAEVGSAIAEFLAGLE